MLRSDQTRNTRYTQGAAKVDSYANRIGWWDRRVFLPSPLDVSIVISSRYNLRPDLMAYDAYGKSNLSWILLQYNNIVDINLEFVTGATILVPLPQRVNAEFLTQNVAINIITSPS